jgi:hypothetical protein
LQLLQFSIRIWFSIQYSVLPKKANFHNPFQKVEFPKEKIPVPSIIDSSKNKNKNNRTHNYIMHCPLKIFQKLAPDPRVHVQRKNSSIFFFSRPLLTMSQVGLAQKVLKSASLLDCACSKPRNFLLAERIGVVT